MLFFVDKLFMKDHEREALEAALNAAAPDGGSWELGEWTYNDSKSKGFDTYESLKKALDAAAPDGETWTRGKEAFYAIIDPIIVRREKNAKKTIKWFFIIALIAMSIGWVRGSIEMKREDAKNAAQTQSQTQVQTPAQVHQQAILMAKAGQILLAEGWESGSFTVGTVDLSKDKSTAGQGAYNEQGARSPAEIVGFLKSGSSNANELLNQIKSGDTDATTNQILDPENWIAVQSLVSFNYKGNTYLNDGTNANAGTKDGHEGEIFLMFINPTTGKATYVRGACANPQTVAPVIVTKTDTITNTIVEYRDKIVNVPYEVVKWKTKYITKYVYIHDKDKGKGKDPTLDPYAQGNAPIGGGQNEDPGPGTYIDPDDMDQPPDDEYVVPDPPSSSSATSSTPAPTPEAGATTLDAPATGTVTAPGQ